ncbi:MAG: hypothetical protein Q9163_005920 [Psora crenata]
MSFPPLVLVPLGLSLGAVLLYVSYGLLVNYNAARKTGLPLIILPFDCGNPLWMIIDRKIVQLVRRHRIPFFCSWGTFIRFNWRGWEIQDRYRAHQQLGDAFFFVTPGKNYLQLCDEDAVSEILQRPADFPRQPELAVPLSPSEDLQSLIRQTDGPEWQRHRRITASSFTEQVHQRVWTESILQSTSLIRYWSSKSSINTVAKDTRTVSLHVMSAALFGGKSYPFRGTDEDSSSTKEEDSSSYGEALKIILDRCMPLVVLGRKNLSNPWLPKSFRQLYQATLVVREHMTEAYEGEKRAMMHNDQVDNNLMTSLVRASQANVDQKGSTHQEGLTEEEVYGNLAVYNFAGHDATANTLAICICLLATQPSLQTWIEEEVNGILGDVPSNEASFEDVFPRLPRCLAVVYETVRLYTAVAIARSTGSSPQPLTLGTRTVLIPKNTVVRPNHSALHTHPRYWGYNSLEFRPPRWIITDPRFSTANAYYLATSHPVEHLKEPPTWNNQSSPFVGWSGGARNCPGRKFAQVELVGVLVGLFRNFEVKPVPLQGEEDWMARARLSDQIRMDMGCKPLLQMLHPEMAMLEWKRRAPRIPRDPAMLAHLTRPGQKHFPIRNIS